VACDDRYVTDQLGWILRGHWWDGKPLHGKEGTLQLRSCQGLKPEDAETLCYNVSVVKVGFLCCYGPVILLALVDTAQSISVANSEQPFCRTKDS
jgi:hypothetical protein